MGLMKYEKNLVVLDEAGIFASSSAATSKRVRTLKQLVYLIRHLNASILFIAQSRKSLVPELRENLVSYQLKVKKISTHNRSMTIYQPREYTNEDGEEEFDFVELETVYYMPSSQLPYDSKFLPVFKIDLSLEDLLDELADLDSMHVIEFGSDIIENLLHKNKEKTVTKKMKIEKEIKMHPELTNTEIANLYDCSDRWIQRIRKRTLKDG